MDTSFLTHVRGSAFGSTDKSCSWDRLDRGSGGVVSVTRLIYKSQLM